MAQCRCNQPCTWLCCSVLDAIFQFAKLPSRLPDETGVSFRTAAVVKGTAAMEIIYNRSVSAAGSQCEQLLYAYAYTTLSGRIGLCGSATWQTR